MTASNARPPLRLPPAAFRDLATIADGTEALTTLAAHLEAARRARSLYAATRAIAEVSGVDGETLRGVATALVSVLSLARTLGTDAPETLRAIDSALENPSQRWTAENAERWSAAKPLVEPLLDANGPWFALAKAQRLAYSYANTLLQTDLITDIRPVFSEGADAIARMSTSFVLGVEYASEGRVHRVDLALDYSDIEKLQEQCERAKKKAATILRSMDGADWVTAVAGRDDEIGEEGA